MKESGLGTPATRAATIENLLDKEYVLREGKALRATDKGLALIRMLGDHQLTRPDLTGGWEKRLVEMEHGQDDRAAFMRDIRRFTDRDGRLVQRQGPHGDARRAARDRPLPALRRHDRGAAEELLLHLLEVGGGAGLRLHDLEAAGRPHDQPRGGGGARRAGQGLGRRWTPSASSSAPARRRAAAARSWSAARASAARRGRAARSRAAGT